MQKDNVNEARESLYKSRAAAFGEQEKKAASKSSAISWLRVAVFVVGAIVAFYLFRNGNNAAGAIAILVFYAVFVLLMRWHSRLEFSHQQLRLQRLVNEQEIERLEGKLSKFDGGKEFVDDLHPYTSDLDVFGQNSLFQLLNRSVTSIGRAKLATWFRQAASPQEVLQRQAAVAELAAPDQLEWLQGFIALPMHYKHEETSAQSFILWFKDKAFYQQHAWLKPLVFILPILTVAAIVAWLSGISGWIAVGLLLVQFMLAYRFTKERDEYYDKSIGIYEAMQSFTKQLQHVEQEQFKAPRLQHLHQELTSDGINASTSLSKLASIIDFSLTA
ncbi:hypothetical protein GCM10028895_39930 [Pontibacter rugosus]